MADARLPDRWLTERRIQKLSDRAFRAFTLALMWSVSSRTDGVIDHSDLDLIPGFPRGAEEELVKSGLWVEHNGGWLIAEFCDTQTSKAELHALARARASNRERQARYRLKQAEQGLPADNVDNNVTETVTETVIETVTTQARQGKAEALPYVTEEELLAKPPSPKSVVKKSGTSPARARGTRLPDGWKPPDEVIRAMHEQFPGMDLRAVHADFCDYWHAKAGQGATKVDWVATWRRWIRKADADTPHRNGHPRLSTADQRVAQILAMKSTHQPSITQITQAPRLELL